MNPGPAPTVESVSPWAHPAADSPPEVRWRLATDVIDRSGVVERIESRLPARTSGPEPAPVRVVLAGLIMAVLAGRGWYVTEAASQLASLPRRLQQAEGVRRPRRGYDRGLRWHENDVVWSYRALARRMCAVAGSMERSVAMAARYGIDLTDTQAADNADFLRDVVTDLLGASQPDGYADTTIRIDGTGIAGWVRNTRTDNLADAVDPDVGWRVRDDDRRKPSLLGYSAHVAVGVHDDQTMRVVGLEVTAGNEPEEPAGRRLALHLADRRPVERVVADMGYTRTLGFHKALREAGVQTVFDLGKEQQGPASTLPGSGALLIDATPHCPATPKGLWRLGPAPSRSRTDGYPEKVADYQDRLASRAPWRAVPHTAPEPDGSARVTCPALRGKVVCPLRAVPVSDRTVPHVLDPPDLATAPPICTQKTVTVPSIANGRPLLPMPYGDSEWRDAYQSQRAVNEGVFGQLKYGPHWLLTKGRVRLRGITRTTLMLALGLAAFNVRRTWRELLDSADRHEAPAQTSLLKVVPVDIDDDEHLDLPAHAYP